MVHPGSVTSSTEGTPPSPALSTASVPFQTSIDLRGRSPGDGVSSLQSVQQHARKNTAASLQIVIEADHASHGVPLSPATPITAASATKSVERNDLALESLPGLFDSRTFCQRINELV
jgi:hypothetical protein